MGISFGKLIVESFKERAGPQAVTKHGFATVKQRSSLIPLKVLLDSRVNEFTVIPAGSLVHVKEKELSTLPWGTTVYESNAIGQPFIILTINDIEFITDPEGKPLAAVA